MTWALRTELDLEQANVHLERLEDAGLLGLVEEDGRVTAYFPDRVDGLPLEGRWESIEERDWNSAWKAGIAPVTVGRITITPSWIEVPGALVIEPAQAFGTGHHETTTGCLAALQSIDLTAAHVVDVGTGTGILALAARRLGAPYVLGVDVDELAVMTARANALANGLEIDVRTGSADAVHGLFDVVVANLDTPTVTVLAPDLARLLAPEGDLIVSGVSIERADEAAHALGSSGLEVTVTPGREWAVLLGRHRVHR